MSAEDRSELEATIGVGGVGGVDGLDAPDAGPRPSDPDEITVYEEVSDPLPHPTAVRRGQSIGRYVVVDKIGSGSMGVVFRAYDPDLDRKVALKLVEVRRRKGRDIQARLLREAQAIAKVSHPNVIAVYDVGAVELGVFVAMEYIDGQTLKEWMKSKVRTPSEVIPVFLQAARGLAAAHAAGIVHRDFKPDNVMIDRGGPGRQDGEDPGRDMRVGRVRVLDFGLARAAVAISTERPATVDGASSLLEEHASPSLDASLTRDGIIVGTPAYMAPEQHLGATAGPKADQFSFCVALWEALYGERPFPGDTHAAVAFNMTRGNRHPPVPGRNVPRWLHDVVVKGLEPDIAARHPSMTALADALERDPPATRRGHLATVGAAGLTLLGTLLVVGLLEDRDTVCQSAGDRMAELWDDERRDAMTQAFSATTYPFADDAWKRTAVLLDEWSKRWVGTRVEACEATRVHGEQSEELLDLRMACLDRHLSELSALLEVFETPNREIVIGSVDAVHGLGDLADCSDLDALRHDGPVLDDPAQIAEAQRLTAALRPTQARVRAGSFKGLDTELNAIQADVEALDHPPLSQRYWSLRGQVEQATGQTPRARHSWEEAFRQALAADDRARATWIAGRLTYIVGHSLAQQRGGEFWSDTAMVLLGTIDDDGTTLASIRSAQASMWHTSGQLDRAAELGEEVLAFWSERDPNSPELAEALGNAGGLERSLGNFERAIELHRRSLQLVRERYGDQHPEVAGATHQLGLSLSFASRNDEALPELERALELFVAAHGRRNTGVATVLDSLGRTLRRVGRLEEAQQRHQEAYEIWKAEYGETHPDVAVSLMNIGYTAFAREDYEQSLESFEDAVELYRRSVGDDHPGHLYAATAIAQAHLKLGAPAKARQAAEHGLQLDAAQQVDPTLVAELQFLVAMALLQEGSATRADRARAIELAETARATYLPRAEHWKPQLEEIERWLAEHR